MALIRSRGKCIILQRKKEELSDEIKFLKSLDSDFTVQIKSFSWQDKRLCVVTDYATGK